MKRILKHTIITCASLAILSACSVTVDDRPDDDDSSSSDTWPSDPYPSPSPIPQVVDIGESCVSADSSWYATQYGSYFSSYSSYRCFENEDYTWRTSCQSEDCEGMTVYVHYMLTEELGQGLTVNIEAFDNEQFSGYPKASVTIQDFHAKTGEYDKANLYMEPGEYFLRAFVSNRDDGPVPYPFGDMELVAGEPMGIYGALSGAEKVAVRPNRSVDPVHIKLDKLFKKPGSEPDTRAHLRTILKTDLHGEIASGRKVFIEMFTDEDFERTPAHRFVMASELLKIDGEQGQAEFVSPSLEVGDYFVRVYIDANNNEYYDDGELFGVHAQGGLPRYVRIQEETVRSVMITLAKEAL